MGKILTAQDREVLLALSHSPEEFVSVGELVDLTEGSIKSGLVLISLRELILCGMAEASEIGWRWRLTDGGREYVRRIVAEAMNTKGAEEVKAI